MLKRIQNKIYVNNKLNFYERMNHNLSSGLCVTLNYEKLSGMELIELTLDNLTNFDDINKDNLLKEIKCKSKVYAIVFNDKILHYSCICNSKIFIWEIQKEIIVPDNFSYIYNCFTTPAFRGKGLFPMMLDYIIQDKSKSYLISALDDNEASIQSIQKLNFSFIGYCRYNKFIFIKKFANKTKLEFI